MDSQGLFDAIEDSAIILDKAGRIVNWNAGSTSLFGYAKKDVVGRSINFIYDRNYPFPKIIQEINGTNKKWREEITFHRKGGSKGYCIVTLSPLPPTEQGKILALLTHQDITKSKKLEDDLRNINSSFSDQLKTAAVNLTSANMILVNTAIQLDQCERNLRDSELRFHLLVENATDIISRHTPDGTYLYVSPASTESLGYDPEDLVGTNIYKLIHHDDHVKIKKAFTRRRETPMIKPIVYRVKRKGGEFRWFESNIRLIMGERRHINEIQLASRDVTDRVLDKKARLRGQQLAHVFRLSTMEEMASGMAHEISQPLAAIVNYTRGCVRHLQNSDYDQDQIRGVMEKAVAQAERAGEIIQRLKNFFCKGQLVKTPCKINNVVRETAGLMKHELTQSKTKIEFDFDKNLPFIFIDKIQIQQVLLNLMQNAIEAMQEIRAKEKRIFIQTTASNSETIEITLNDTGPGFSKDLTNNVFMPFFTTKAHGRGMGLAICRSIIEAHGGEFTINPKTTNTKSWIRFSLPMAI